MVHTQARGLRRLLNAWRYSMAGFSKCFRHEEAFRQEVFASLAVIPLGVWLGETALERAVLVGAWLIVPVVELLNSAVEANVDRVGLEHHQLSARAKDIASAAVFLSLVYALVVWSMILVPRLLG